MQTRYRFADCELRPIAPFLLRDGAPVAASSQVLGLLRFLVQHPDRVIEKSELLDQVWGHQHLSDAAFARAVMRTRLAIGDDGQRQSAIRTVHGRGVMFVAPVEVLEQVDPANSATVKPPRAYPASPRILWMGIAALILLAGALGYRYWPNLLSTTDAPVATTDAGERILVLRAIEYDQSDPVLTDLAAAWPGVLEYALRAEGIQLYSASAFADEASMSDWQREDARLLEHLGANYALQLSLRRTAAGLAVDLSMNGLADAHLSLTQADAIALTRMMSRAVVGEILGLQIDQVSESSLLVDPLLADLVLRARSASARGDYQTAIKAYDAALAMAPDDPTLAFQRLDIEIQDGLPADQASAQMMELLAQRQASLPTLQRAQILQRAGVHAWYGGDSARASKLLNEALTLSMAAKAHFSTALIRNALAMAQQSAGAQREAWENATLAVDALRLESRPYFLSMALTNLGYLAEERGRLLESESLHREALELRRQFHFGRLTASSYYAVARSARRNGRLSEAAELINESLRLLAENGQELERVDALEEQAEIQIRRGQFAAAESTLDQAQALAIKVESPLSLAWIKDVRAQLWMSLGNPADAVGLLQQSALEQLELGEAYEANYSRISLADALDADSATRQAAMQLRSELARTHDQLSNDQRVALAVVELRAARRAGQLEKVMVRCSAALELARNSGTIDREADAAIECGHAQYEAGNTAEATHMLRLAERWSPEYFRLQPLRDALATQ